MAKNYLSIGKDLRLVAPTGGVTVGLGYLIGALFVVALQTVAAGSVFTGTTTGIWSLPKVSSETWAIGNKVYWDNANARCTTVAAGMREIGIVAAAAASSTTTGEVRLNGVKAPINDIGVPVSKSTAGAVTLTAAEILSGLVVADPNGAGRTYTLPTAALLVAALPGCQVGDIVRFKLINGADAAEVLTIAAGSGGAFDANQTASSQVVGQNTSKDVIIRLTNVTASSEAYVVYA